MPKPDDASASTTAMVKNYVAVRDKIKEIGERHSKELSPYNEILDQIGAKLQEVLDKTDAQSIKTSAGTVYVSTRYSAALSDPKAFMDFVISTHNFELMDRRANATACRDYTEEKGAAPPGVNLSGVRSIGVRRA